MDNIIEHNGLYPQTTGLKFPKRIKLKIIMIKKKIKLWNLKISIVPIIIGVFGTIPKSLEKDLSELNVEFNISQIQTIF